VSPWSACPGSRSARTECSEAASTRLCWHMSSIDDLRHRQDIPNRYIVNLSGFCGDDPPNEVVSLPLLQKGNSIAGKWRAPALAPAPSY
jgi:hypothetical protein